MASTLEFFGREIAVATRGLTPEAINRKLAAFARSELAEAIARGEASESYDVFVNGRKGAVEETVKAPGPILYVFTNWEIILTTALQELAKRAPRRSGRFASSFIVVVAGRVVTDFKSIAAESEVIITNFRPYTRKIETGAMKSPRRAVFDGAQRVLAARFRAAFAIKDTFLNIGGGVHPMMPYILRRDGGRRGRRAGNTLTYPSLVIRAV